MKRLLVLSLVAMLSVGLLSVGALGAPDPATETDNTYVEWYLDIPMQCQLSIDAHEGISLGILDSIGTFTASGYAGITPPDRQVTTESNCEYDLNVEVMGVTAPISGMLVLEDFEMALIADVNAVNNWTFNDWKKFSGFLSTKKIGSAGDNSDYSTIDSSTWTMDYAYTTDYDDENDYYRVDLRYTASTT